MSGFNITREDQDMLRNYVTAADHLQYSTLPQGVAAVTVTHCNLPQKLLDLRFDLHNTVFCLDFIFSILRSQSTYIIPCS
jgi:hypothetical protein